uniref:Nucleic-acid-binding protein n=1 Tax=Schizaphis graminum TaxID=13262 RepID=A0A2S2P9D3_SCHGA
MSHQNTRYKRNLPSSPSSPSTGANKSKIFVTPNRFAALDDGTASFPDVFSPPPVTVLSPAQGDSSNQTSTHETKQQCLKAPTIFIKNVNNFSKIKYDLINTLGPDAVTFKASKEFLTIRTVNIDIFNQTVCYLGSSHFSFHTHIPQHMRPIQAVFRHLHHSTPTEEIETALTDLGFSVIKVSIILNKKTKAPLPLFLVNLEPIEHNLKIFQVSKILNSVVKIEKPRKSRHPPQCKRCQMYGHTHNWCHHQPRCVKCSENHTTSDCTKSRDTPAKCVLCSGSHTANYKGCPAIKNQIKSYFKKRSAPLAADIPLEPPPFKRKNYADATKNHNTIDSSPPISTILSNFISNLNAIISPLISLLTTVLNSLLKKTAC